MYIILDIFILNLSDIYITQLLQFQVPTCVIDDERMNQNDISVCYS